MSIKASSILFKNTLIYLLALLLGICFSIIPSAANFLMSEKGMNLSKLDYGNLFILMMTGSLSASYFGGIITKKTAVKNLLLFGLIMTVLAMGLFSLEELFLTNKLFAYPILMLDMFFLGCGFGAILTSLSSYVLNFSSDHSLFNIAISAGCTLGPLLFIVFLSLGLWWLMPLAIAVFLIGVGIAAWRKLPKVQVSLASFSLTGVAFKKTFWIYALIAALYGLCETLIGTWGVVFIKQEKNVSLFSANYALSLFWGFMTLGRFMLAFLRNRFGDSSIICLLSLLLIPAFIFLSKTSTECLVFVAFSLIGLCCSGIFPWVLTCAAQSFPKTAPTTVGAIIGMYMIGYGFASSGMASVERRTGWTLHEIYALGSLFALALGILTLWAIRKKKSLAR